MTDLNTTRDYAQHLDSKDPLRDFRDRFLFPKQNDGTAYRYFCGNSLGLQPQTAKMRLR